MQAQATKTTSKKRVNSAKNQPTLGDHMRIKEGPFRGAEGTVSKIEHTTRKVQIIEIMQLNGNPIRLPRRSYEFAGFQPKPRSLRGK